MFLIVQSVVLIITYLNLQINLGEGNFIISLFTVKGTKTKRSFSLCLRGFAVKIPFAN